MIDFEQVQRLLAEKKQLMLSFEEATEEMLFCPFEQLQPLVLQREEKMLQMKALDAKIRGLCTGKDGALLLAAVENDCNRAALPAQLQQVYDAGMQIKTIVFRLKESNMQATFRLRNEQKTNFKKNQNNQPKPGCAGLSFFFAPCPAGAGQVGQSVTKAKCGFRRLRLLLTAKDATGGHFGALIQ